MTSSSDRWPPLPIAEWEDTRATLHMWTQIAGKIRLALTPPVNHWWHVPLYVDVRGLTTSPIPWGDGSFALTFDFLEHQLLAETSDGRVAALPLAPMPVRRFYAEAMDMIRGLGISVRIWPMPVEVPSPIRFDADEQHASYDRAWVGRWWTVLKHAASAFHEFRGRFLGKSSPVHFFWGSFDLAVTRFSGRPAPRRDDPIMREAYSHEVISAGFWPGALGVGDAAFYAYAAPEPAGFPAAPIGPAPAAYNSSLGEFLFPYADVRSAADPRASILEFLQSTYAAGADLARWDRASLERTS